MPEPLKTVKFLLSETDPRRLGPCAGEVVFIGRSNVGKSTLLNFVCRKELARVSSRPGSTRTINVFSAGPDRWLVDLPGYGFASRSTAEVEEISAMIEGYLNGRRNLRMVFVLVDAKVGPTPLDLRMLKWLEAKGLPWRVVATKTDQLKASRAAVDKQGSARAMGLEPSDIAWVSAQSGLGMRELSAEVSALLGD